MPINPKYRPDSLKWVCTCLYFVTSQFLICKHLIQTISTVLPTFYLEVKHNRTTPFLLHQVLQPEGPHHPSTGTCSAGDTEVADKNRMNLNAGDEELEDDNDESLIDTPGWPLGIMQCFVNVLLNILRQSDTSVMA
jgi:hypothetical protein